MNNKTQTHADLPIYQFVVGSPQYKYPYVYVVVVVIIVRHQVGRDSRVSASSNNLFKGLPIRLRPTGLQSSVIFATPLLSIAVTCRSQFHLQLLGF